MDEYPESLRKVLWSLVDSGEKVVITYKSGLSEFGIIRYDALHQDIEDPFLINICVEGGPVPNQNYFLPKSIVRVSSEDRKKVIWDLARDEPIIWVHSQ